MTREEKKAEVHRIISRQWSGGYSDWFEQIERVFEQDVQRYMVTNCHICGAQITGNACLSCGHVATDATHLDEVREQQGRTQVLLDARRSQRQQSHRREHRETPDNSRRHRQGAQTEFADHGAQRPLLRIGGDDHVARPRVFSDKGGEALAVVVDGVAKAALAHPLLHEPRL